jgi:hypothetical protein
MDFSNRNVPSHAPAPGAQPAASATLNNGPANNKRGKGDKSKWDRIAFVVMVTAIVILLLSLSAALAYQPKGEDQYVDSTKLQAVFLNTGQVYFGNVTTLNSKYFVLTNIYYLQTSSSNSGSASASSNANSSVTLVKLGCELHRPYDKMVINSDQVTFWENLESGGQVAKAVSTFQKDNPNGQKCTDQSSSASSNSSSSAQNASPSATTPTTTTPATKP